MRSIFSFLPVLLAGAACGLTLPSRASTPDADARLRDAWRAQIARIPMPEEGCFKASYPSRAWRHIACSTADARPYLPRTGLSRSRRAGDNVGGGNDYAAVVAGAIADAQGSFPAATDITSELGYNSKADSFSLQLNSNFFASPACDNAALPSACTGWQQFIYSNTGLVFMQYWLIDYNATCPAGWHTYGQDCYRNSSILRMPGQPLANLASLKLSGAAAAGGTDTVVLTTPTDAYGTTGRDRVVSLAGNWNAAEFNVFGDGGGSMARFNKGASLTVLVALSDGSTAAPACRSNDGTTGESNDFTAGACTAAGGVLPAISFTETR